MGELHVVATRSESEGWSDRQLLARTGSWLSSDVVKIAAIVVLFSTFPLQSRSWRSVNDADLWWHLRAGEWIMQHHHLPVTDPFSSTGAGKPWIAYSWSFEVLLYEVVRNWDLAGVVGYVMLTWMLCVAALFHLVRGATSRFWLAVLLALLAGIVFERVTAARPGTFTVLFFILELDILLRAQKTGSRRLLLLVPVLIWLWANVHLQFVYGLFVLGIFCLEPALNRIVRYRESCSNIPGVWMWATLLVSTLATTLTAYGTGSYRLLFDIIRESRVYTILNETRANDFSRVEHYIVLLLCLAAAAALGRNRRPRPLWILLLVWSAIMTFRAERDIWVATVISVVILAATLPRRESVAVPIHRRVWLAATAGVLFVLVLALKIGPTSKQLLTIVASEYPMGAVAYIHEQHLRGPLFNDFDWGGYLIYALPEIPVVMDGRTNVHDEGEVMRSISTWNVLSDWTQDPLLQQANIVVAQPKYALTQMLAKDPHFKVVFDDGVAVLFQRVQR